MAAQCQGGHSAAARGQRLPAAAPPKAGRDRAQGPTLPATRRGQRRAVVQRTRKKRERRGSQRCGRRRQWRRHGQRARAHLCQLALHQLGSKSPGPGCSCPGLRARGRLGGGDRGARRDNMISPSQAMCLRLRNAVSRGRARLVAHLCIFKKTVFELILNLFKQRPHRENGGPFCRLGARSSCRTQMQRSCSTSAKDAILKKRGL